MAATSHHLLHHLFRPPQSPPSPSTFLSILLKPPTLSLFQQTAFRANVFVSLSSVPTRPLFFCNSVSSSSLNLARTPPSALSLRSEQESIVEDDNGDEIDEDEDEDEEEGIEVENVGELELEEKVNERAKPLSVELPNLTIKEKKELSSYANGLGKKLKCQLVGKSGVTASVASAFIENLESNELLKIKIHRTCPGELTDVVKHLEASTGSVVIAQIGRTVILYRPSLAKLKAEEKKLQNRRVFVRKSAVSKPTLPSRRQGPVPRLSGNGRRDGPVPRLSGNGRRDGPVPRLSGSGRRGSSRGST